VKKFFNVLIILAGCAGAVYGIGLIVPRNLTEVSKTNLLSKPDAVYALVSDVTTWPRWHPDVARVEQRPERNDHPIWRITTKSGEMLDLEVKVEDGPAHWMGDYVRKEQRVTLKLDTSWYGEGTSVLFGHTTVTTDPWVRAKHFLLPDGEVSAITLLNAISKGLGEPPHAEKKKQK
jgi:hypothetical protein